MSVSIVSVDHIPLSIGDLNIKYHPLVEIYSSSHLYGSIIGSETVELQVYGILDDIITEEVGLGLVHCQFGEKFTLSTIEFDELIVSCSTPAADSPGNVSLSLTYGGRPFSSNTLTFEYTTQPKVESIYPTSGHIAGGTSVRIQGLNLQSISCKFGNELSYGYVDSENTTVCISPRSTTASSQAISLLLDSSKEWLDTGLDFYYTEPFTVESVHPLSIDRGVDFIRVNGRGYSRALDLQCCFGGESGCIHSDATVSTNTTLKCPLPSWEVLQEIGPTVPLAITSNSIDFVQGPSPRIYQSSDMIVVTKLNPKLGPAYGGTIVDVYGLGFQEHASYSCWFGKVSSRAEYRSDGHIQCITPTSFVKDSEQVAVVGFTLSTLTPHPLDSSLNLTFYSQPTRLEIYPTHGVSSGNTEIKIGSPELSQVLGKLQSSGTPLDPTCRFDTTVVPASIVDYEGGYIVCTSPPIEAANQLNITTQSVQVSVSLNGQDYISTSEHYHYYQPISIHSVTPDIVWIEEEATELVIRGSHFLPLNQASCIVGEELIQADVVSSSEVRCLVQNLNYFDQVVPVSVSLNGGVDSSNVLPLSCRVNAPVILSASPLFVAEAGGTTVKLQGTGFEQIKGRAFIKLNDALVPLSVIDTTVSFDAPSGIGNHTIQISYHGSTFVDIGFELQYLPPLQISSVKPAWI